MGFKLGAITGLAVGYYLGTKATQRQAEMADRLADTAKDKAMALVELGIERARDAVSSN